MVAPGFLQTPEVQKWLNGAEPAWMLLDFESFNTLRLVAVNLRVSPVLIGGASELEEAYSILAKDGAQAVIVQGFFGPYSDI